MAFKDILVHMDDNRTMPSRLDTAVRLARAHGARLTGVYAMTMPELPAYVAAQMGPEVMAVQAKAIKEGAEKAKAAFDAAVAREGLTASEWRTGEGHPVDVLALHARYADLVVMGQRDAEDDIAYDLPDQLILAAARPVLVVPYAGTYPNVGKTIMVAWDGSQLATRAVHDALPLLKQADRVDVIAVNPDDAEAGHGDVPSADICSHLARHGVKAEAQHIQSDGTVGIGDMLLSRAADQGTDLLVMGGYGHARLRELVLGGVTKHILEHMTVPVLMSH